MRCLLVAVLVLEFLLSGQASAAPRVALVIGNSAYAHVPRLTNPENDATAIGVLFKSIGFDNVEVKENLGIAEFRKAVSDFTDLSRDSEIAVIYFAGHGIEVDGTNYLVPTDAKLKRDIDIEDETVSLDRFVKVLEPAKKLRLVILDACRDNPYANSIKRTLASRSIGRGLAKAEPAGSNTLIAFAARAGSTATDGDGPNSPFTTALLRHLATPSLDIRIALGRVRDEVLKATGDAQEPFVYGSLGGDSVVLALSAEGSKQDSRADRLQSPDTGYRAAEDYAMAAKVGTRAAFDAYLAKYPDGFYADLARAQRAKVAAVDSHVDVEKPVIDKRQKERSGLRAAQDRCVQRRWPEYLAMVRSASGEEAARNSNNGYARQRMRETWCRNG